MVLDGVVDLCQSAGPARCALAGDGSVAARVRYLVGLVTPGRGTVCRPDELPFDGCEGRDSLQ